MSGQRLPRMYTDLASWWPLLSPPSDYVEEAAFYVRTLDGACDTPPRTLLELGSGGGNNASHMKSRFEIVLVDRSPDMLAISRRLNPECEHVEGDMRSVRLGRIFDCVFVHDAVMYMTSEADLRRAMETAFVPCRPGGVALFVPDHVRDRFRPSTGHGGEDGDTRSLRYLEWTWDPDPTDATYVVDYVYALRERDGDVRVEWDRHVEGCSAEPIGCGCCPRSDSSRRRCRSSRPSSIRAPTRFSSAGSRRHERYTMIGAYAEHARAFLFVWVAVTTLFFALPLFFTPLAWARMMRFEIPAHSDLAVYFGRCLGAFALVLEAMTLRAALGGPGIVFVFEAGIAVAVSMVLVHLYGAVKGIQPITETLEIPFWVAAVLLYILFFPVVPGV